MHAKSIRTLGTILALSLYTLLSGQVVAASHQTIKVKASADTDALDKGFLDIEIRLTGKCMDAAGAPTQAAMQKCVCARRSEVSADVDTMEEVLTRHPTWKDKMLSWQRGEDGGELPAYNVALLRQMTRHCH